MAKTSKDRKPAKPATPGSAPDQRKDHYATRRDAFLAHLALTSNVKESAKIAGIPCSTLYLWQERYPEFAGAWLKALAAGYERLEMAMLKRARCGVKRTIYYEGKKVATVRDYDNKTALQLLRMHKEAAALVRAAQAEAAEEAAQEAAQAKPARDTLDERLRKANVRLRAHQAEKRRRQRALAGGDGAEAAATSAGDGEYRGRGIIGGGGDKITDMVPYKGGGDASGKDSMSDGT